MVLEISREPIFSFISLKEFLRQCQPWVCRRSKKAQKLVNIVCERPLLVVAINCGNLSFGSTFSNTVLLLVKLRAEHWVGNIFEFFECHIVATSY